MPYKPGQFPPVEKIFKRLDEIAIQELDARLYAFAVQQLNSFKQRLYKQLFLSFTDIPLSLRYLMWKIDNELDERVMIRTGHYVRSIKLQTRELISDSSWTKTYYIGFDRGARAVDENNNPIALTLDLLAKVQEFGSELRNIPARPHWRPMLAIIRGRAPALRKDVRVATMTRLSAEFRGRGA